ncbi:rhodanese-like domain-containing protein [Terriglobus roseus]|uniref:Rhodanese-related sulfurtransferase n=1 Tax=Terriglobus roseus TaxID=392734 RepID=A0A1G7I2Y3_9BACT|nr:Rhodanese-related sulfurtransferase [Terriglobus roseus]
MLPYEISVAEVAQMRASQTPFVLLDVREPWEIETAHIAGSKDIPMNDIPARANNELDPDAHIVVLCHHGARSLSVTAWLRREGYDNVQSVAGGIEQWSREIDNSVPRY